MDNDFVFDRTKLKIYIEDYSETDYFVYAEYESINLSLKMTLCDFIEDCDWWGYSNVRCEEKDGNVGWLFEKIESKESIEVQVQGFIYQYKDIICKKFDFE